MIFLVPIFGLAVGAAMGAVSGSFTRFGIDNGFIDSCRNRVTEGTSALFVLTGASTPDKVREAFKDVKMELISSNLTDEQEAELREAFGGGEEE